MSLDGVRRKKPVAITLPRCGWRAEGKTLREAFAMLKTAEEIVGGDPKEITEDVPDAKDLDSRYVIAAGQEGKRGRAAVKTAIEMQVRSRALVLRRLPMRRALRVRTARTRPRARGYRRHSRAPARAPSEPHLADEPPPSRRGAYGRLCSRARLAVAA